MGVTVTKNPPRQRQTHIAALCITDIVVIKPLSVYRTIWGSLRLTNTLIFLTDPTLRHSLSSIYYWCWIWWRVATCSHVSSLPCNSSWTSESPFYNTNSCAPSSHVPSISGCALLLLTRRVQLESYASNISDSDTWGKLAARSVRATYVDHNSLERDVTNWRVASPQLCGWSLKLATVTRVTQRHLGEISPRLTQISPAKSVANTL